MVGANECAGAALEGMGNCARLATVLSLRRLSRNECVIFSDVKGVMEPSAFVRKHIVRKAGAALNSSGKSCSRAWQGAFTSGAHRCRLSEARSLHTEARPQSLSWATSCSRLLSLSDK